MKKVISFVCLMLILAVGAAGASVTVEDFRLVASKPVYATSDSVDAILFANTDEPGSVLVSWTNPATGQPLYALNFSIFRLYDLGLEYVASKRILIGQTPPVTPPGFSSFVRQKTMRVGHVLDIANGALLTPGSYVLQFVAERDQGGEWAYVLSTHFSVVPDANDTAVLGAVADVNSNVVATHAVVEENQDWLERIYRLLRSHPWFRREAVADRPKVSLAAAVVSAKR